MLIPMKQQAIIITEDRTQAADRHGKYPTIPVTTVARVSFSKAFVKNANGTVIQAKIEVDLPPTVNLSQGLKIEAQDAFGVWHKAEIITIDDATNLAGNRVLYRTCICA